MTIGKYLEKVNHSQVCAYYDKHNNLKWLGKAEFAPIYLDWCKLSRSEYVGQELRVYEGGC